MLNIYGTLVRSPISGLVENCGITKTALMQEYAGTSSDEILQWLTLSSHHPHTQAVVQIMLSNEGALSLCSVGADIDICYSTSGGSDKVADTGVEILGVR